MCKHRSLATPPLPGACATHHCQGPVIQGQLPRENTRCASGCCNVMLASASAGSPHILYPSLPPARVSQSPLISRCCNPVLAGREQKPEGNLHTKGGAKTKVEPQELCEQRREREISLCSLRSSGLNPHNELEVPCICGIPEQAMNEPKIEAVDFGRNCRLGVCYLQLTCFDFYVYLSIVFSTCYHWWIYLLVWLHSSFFSL